MMLSCQRGSTIRLNKIRVENVLFLKRATMFVKHTAEREIATLRVHEAELRQAGLRSLSLFGSVARDRDRSGQDHINRGRRRALQA